jgi:integrase/recombinase XerD
MVLPTSIPPTIPALLEAYYLDMRVKNWAESTVQRRRHCMRRFVNWLLDRSIESVVDITPEIIDAYQRSLYHVGNLRTRASLRSATQASYLTAIAHWLHWTAVKKFIPFNPALGLELPKEEHRLPGNYLGIDEVERLINQADVKTMRGIRNRAIMEVLYSSAIRRGELLNLSLVDIDRPRRLLAIRQGKGNKDRVVPIGVRALEWMEKYIADVRPWLAAGNETRHSRPTPEPSDKVFLGDAGRPMQPSFLSLMVRKYLTKAGITKPGSCHVLRHTAATLMLENGADLRSLQTLLGHANLNTTQIYTHITINRLRAVHDATHPAKPDTKPIR